MPSGYGRWTGENSGGDWPVKAAAIIIAVVVGYALVRVIGWALDWAWLVVTIGFAAAAIGGVLAWRAVFRPRLAIRRSRVWHGRAALSRAPVWLVRIDHDAIAPAPRRAIEPVRVIEGVVVREHQNKTTSRATQRADPG